MTNAPVRLTLSVAGNMTFFVPEGKRLLYKRHRAPGNWEEVIAVELVLYNGDWDLLLEDEVPAAKTGHESQDRSKE